MLASTPQTQRRAAFELQQVVDKQARWEKQFTGRAFEGVTPLISRQMWRRFKADRDRLGFSLASNQLFAASVDVQAKNLPPVPVDRAYSFGYARSNVGDVRGIVDGLAINASESDIRDAADSIAASCSFQFAGKDHFALYAQAAAVFAGYPIDIPVPNEAKGITAEGALLRLKDSGWWARKIRTYLMRGAEEAARQNKLTCKSVSAYASMGTVERIKQRDKKTREHMEACKLISDLGEELTLAEVAAKGLSNPRVRFAELMVRIKGYESIAEREGWVANFITYTAPSRFHAVKSRTGEVNEKWEKAGRPSVRDCNDYMQSVWSRARAVCAAENLPFWGVSVKEPHHDGSVHVHAMIFSRTPMEAVRFNEILRAEAMKDSPNEAGAKKHRYTVERIRKSVGGYIVKYLAKNLSSDDYRGEPAQDNLFDGGEGEQRDLFTISADGGKDYLKESVDEAVEKVRCWAGCHGVSRFRVFGGPPVGVWRELRRVRDRFDGSVDIEAVRSAADAGDYGRYIDAMGGPERFKRRVKEYSVNEKTGRKKTKTKFVKTSWQVELFKEMPEKANKYGEKSAPVVKGVVDSAGVFCLTRLSTWKRVGVEVSEGEAVAPRPRENNCNTDLREFSKEIERDAGKAKIKADFWRKNLKIPYAPPKSAVFEPVTLPGGQFLIMCSMRI